jgi:uncharacterized protein (TIGR02453 family)
MTSTTKRSASGTRSFSPALFSFLRELRENNDREWFKANKHRYDEAVQEPALEFVADFAPYLRELSPHFLADPRPVGGSLFRIYRDTRFSRDKAPYKTHTGIHFRHELARDVHAPGFYLHLEPGQVFAAAGVWHPDAQTLDKIRSAIVADPERSKRTTHGEPFGAVFRLAGDALKRAPAGYDADHPLIEDLKRKDFIAVATLSEKTATSAGFIEGFASTCATAAAFVRFLCEAIDVPY